MTQREYTDLPAEMVLTKWMGRAQCANGHPWTPETTRWRRRGDRGKHTAPIERDCLVCKRVSEGKRRKLRIAERNYR